jgi:hypothetical protein
MLFECAAFGAISLIALSEASLLSWTYIKGNNVSYVPELSPGNQKSTIAAGPGTKEPARAPCPSADFNDIRIEGFNKGIVINGCVSQTYKNVEIKAHPGSAGIENNVGGVEGSKHP